MDSGDALMPESIAALLKALADAASFEEAATRSLRPMLDLAAEALAASPFSGKGQLLRAMVHHRPDDGYRRLVVLSEFA